MAKFKDIDFKNKKALIRVDFNVPLDTDKNVRDNTRIVASLPTIKAVLSAGGSVVLMSHLGRPVGEKNLKYSLLPIVKHLSQLIDNEVIFAEDCLGETTRGLSEALMTGQILVLENLRFYKEETDGNIAFAKELAALGDIYINDAFGTAHRAHASTSVIADFFSEDKKCFGLLMGSEVDSLEKALKANNRPITAIIGGAKVSSKIDVLSSMISKVDRVIVGGGMAYTFIKALGGKVGNSLVEEDKLEAALIMMDEAKKRNVQFLLPVDSVNAVSFSNGPESSTTDIYAIMDDEMGLDIGPRSIEKFSEAILSSKTIIWNGPMGVFEFDNFENGTKKIGEAVVSATANGAFSLVGGGDSIAAVKKYGLEDGVSYVSTGGGAMLEYLEGKELPGIASINQ